MSLEKQANVRSWSKILLRRSLRQFLVGRNQQAGCQPAGGRWRSSTAWDSTILIRTGGGQRTQREGHGSRGSGFTNRNGASDMLEEARYTFPHWV
jgi:hypothetical protein